MSRVILLLITDLEIGGTPTVVRELAIRLHSPPEVRIDVACLATRGPVADQLQEAGIRVFPLNAGGPKDVRVFTRLFRLISNGGYDAVFSFLLHANAAAASVSPFLPQIRFLQSIQTTQPNPRWHWLAQSLAHYAAERVIVPSRSVANAAERWADVPSEKIVVIPNAIDPSDFAAAAESASRSVPAIGFIGRLDPIKRIPDLLRAISLLRIPAHLHVFGEGSQRPLIESLISQLNLTRRVTLHGAVSKPQQALAQLDLLVLPSAAEGFGLVLIEAMAAGVPVIATDVPGIRDVVIHKETGLLVPPALPDELAESIEMLLGCEALRRQIVSRARADVAQRFTWNIVLPRYRSLLYL